MLNIVAVSSCCWPLRDDLQRGEGSASEECELYSDLLIKSAVLLISWSKANALRVGDWPKGGRPLLAMVLFPSRNVLVST